MSKSVLISIQPKWCELIASGKKTLEIRKTRPKLETPFKCYIYCTKDTIGICGNGKVIGEFTCDSISEYEAEFHKGNDCYQNIREIFRDTDNLGDDCRDFRILTANDYDAPNDCDFCRSSGLSFDNVKTYLGEEFCGTFYGWHISALKIYDTPKELNELYAKCDNACEDCVYWKYIRVNSEEFDMECSSSIYGCRPIKSPPQSWCYVEESEGKNESL